MRSQTLSTQIFHRGQLTPVLVSRRQAAGLAQDYIDNQSVSPRRLRTILGHYKDYNDAPPALRNDMAGYAALRAKSELSARLESPSTLGLTISQRRRLLGIDSSLSNRVWATAAVACTRWFVPLAVATGLWDATVLVDQWVGFGHALAEWGLAAAATLGTGWAYRIRRQARVPMQELANSLHLALSSAIEQVAAGAKSGGRV